MNGGQESPGFSKMGSNNYSESTYFAGTVAAVYVANDHSGFVAQLAMPSRAVIKYGCPSVVYLSYTFAAYGHGTVANLTVTWFNKTATMIGESISMAFRPMPTRTGSWSIDKLGYAVDPEDVLDGGNQCNHVSWDGATLPTTAGTFALTSLDAPNFNPMFPGYPYGNALPAGRLCRAWMEKVVCGGVSHCFLSHATASAGLQQLAKGSVFGMAVNMFNQLWNTNYPLYQPYNDPLYCTTPLSCKDANLAFRFRLSFGV